MLTVTSPAGYPSRRPTPSIPARSASATRGAALQVGAGQDHHELVAAVARRHVRGADRVPDLARHRAQDLVARLVAVLVVHLLEAVEVEEQHREPLVAPLAALDLERQPVPQHPVGREPGQRVHRRRPLRLVRPALLVRRALPHATPAPAPPPRRTAGRCRTRTPGSPTGARSGPARSASRIAATASGSGTGRRGLMANVAPTLATTAASTTGCRLRGGSVLASSSRRQYSSSRGPDERVVQRPLGREDVHEAEVEPVHRHRPGHRRERVEPADLPEPPARVARLLQQRQRQPARRAQVPPPLLRHPLEEGRLRQHVHPADAEELVQVAEGDRRVELGSC